MCPAVVYISPKILLGTGVGVERGGAETAGGILGQDSFRQLALSSYLCWEQEMLL